MAASATLLSGAAAAAPAPPPFTRLATNEWAAAQPTATGRTLMEVEVHGGKVYAGYGDYTENTGPVVISSFDPASATGFTAEATADSEAVYNLRDVGGTLFAPSTDPRTGADFAAEGPWRNVAALGATHVYDTVTLTGTDLWMVGSQGVDAVAWRSLDGGASWQESLRVPPRAADDFARFYFAGVAGGRLYVQAADYYGGAHAAASVFDRASWASGPSLLTTGGWGWRPVSFGNGFVYHDHGHGMGGNVLAFDGTTARAVAYGYDVDVSPAGVFVLGTDGIVRRSTDLTDWTAVAAAPADSRSIAVSGSDIYVGTASSELWTYRMPSTTKGKPSSPTREAPTKTTRAPKPKG